MVFPQTVVLTRMFKSQMLSDWCNLSASRWLLQLKPRLPRTIWDKGTCNAVGLLNTTNALTCIQGHILPQSIWQRWNSGEPDTVLSAHPTASVESQINPISHKGTCCWDVSREFPEQEWNCHSCTAGDFEQWTLCVLTGHFNRYTSLVRLSCQCTGRKYTLP